MVEGGRRPSAENPGGRRGPTSSSTTRRSPSPHSGKRKGLVTVAAAPHAAGASSCREDAPAANKSVDGGGAGGGSCLSAPAHPLAEPPFPLNTIPELGTQGGIPVAVPAGAPGTLPVPSRLPPPASKPRDNKASASCRPRDSKVEAAAALLGPGRSRPRRCAILWWSTLGAIATLSLGIYVAYLWLDSRPRPPSPPSLPCEGSIVDGSCWQLSMPGQTCADLCAAEGAIVQVRSTLRGACDPEVLVALTARFLATGKSTEEVRSEATGRSTGTGLVDLHKGRPPPRLPSAAGLPSDTPKASFAAACVSAAFEPPSAAVSPPAEASEQAVQAGGAGRATASMERSPRRREEGGAERGGAGAMSVFDVSAGGWVCLPNSEVR